MLRKIGWSIAFLILLVAILAITALAPISYHTEGLPEVDIPDIKLEKGNGSLQAGWSSVNITPARPIDMAGYGPRGPYQSVADSLYSRTVVFDNGAREIIMISLDLVLFPRHVKNRIEKELRSKGFSNDEIFLTATHTHNGFGNWEKSIGGEFAFGEFNEESVETLIRSILLSVEQARTNKSPAKIGFQKIDAGELVKNRLSPEKGAKDPFIRIVHIHKTSGEKGMLISFSGHATNLDADIWQLSRDYPGELIDHLEARQEIGFAMFCAGMVGSHTIDSNIPKGRKRISTVGEKLADKIIPGIEHVSFDSAAFLGGATIDLELPPSQLRISRHLHLRDWLFRFLLGPLEAHIKVVQVGQILFIGMPCDYSGELSVNNNLDELAENYEKNLFITSFNGDYVGYITEDRHYESSAHDEVRVMNWVGPRMGSYFTDLIRKIIIESQ